MTKEELSIKNKIYEETQEFGRVQFVDEIYKLQQENKRLKFYLNDVIFSEFNDDVELAARYLRKLNYIDFDEENQIYINKHNEEPFCRLDVHEKHFFIEDDEINDYVKQIENEALMLKRIVKEAIDYIKNNTYKCQWGDLEQDNEDINISDDLTETEFIEELLQILERTDK